jgi:hypothetical protein
MRLNVGPPPKADEKRCFDLIVLDLTRLEALGQFEALANSLCDLGHLSAPHANASRLKFTYRGERCAAVIADDRTVFGCIIGQTEVGAPAIIALKSQFANRDVGHFSVSSPGRPLTVTPRKLPPEEMRRDYNHRECQDCQKQAEIGIADVHLGKHKQASTTEQRSELAHPTSTSGGPAIRHATSTEAPPEYADGG